MTPLTSKYSLCLGKQQAICCTTGRQTRFCLWVPSTRGNRATALVDVWWLTAHRQHQIAVYCHKRFVCETAAAAVQCMLYRLL
jgi:hypothetical protein